MDRITLIQKIIDKAGFKTYLEIGSQSGRSLLPVRCRNKMAVDPRFKIPFEKKLKWLLKNPANFRTKYFEETSDDFFERRKDVLKKISPVDVVLVDGLHTFEAALKDTLHSLEYLNGKGIIVLHDCLPPNEASSTPAQSKEEAEKVSVEGWTGEWCGDVWKAIVYLREVFPESLEVFVLNDDYGLGIVRVKGEIKGPLTIDKSVFSTIDAMSYKSMDRDRERLLGLKEKSYSEHLIAKF